MSDVDLNDAIERGKQRIKAARRKRIEGRSDSLVEWLDSLDRSWPVETVAIAAPVVKIGFVKRVNNSIHQFANALLIRFAQIFSGQQGFKKSKCIDGETTNRAVNGVDGDPRE